MKALKRATREILEGINWNEVREEFSEHLSRYVQFDTTNPPGNEKEATEFLADLLSSEGIKCRVVESEPGRANLIAEIGDGDETELILLSHSDVVPATPEDWTVPPFSGERKDGYIWGRGTLDCKGLGIMELASVILVKRAGINPLKKVKLMVVADEEMGGKYGAAYVTEELGEGKARWLLNEGGMGTDGVVGNLKAFNMCYGEKGPLWLKIISRGSPGHGSVPIPQSATLRLVKALAEILSESRKYRVLPEHRKALKISGDSFGGLKGALMKLLSTSSFLTSLLPRLSSSPILKAMYSDTASLTMLSGGYKENVIPEKAEAVLDVRLLPGTDPQQYVNDLVSKLNRYGDFEVKIIAEYPASLSELEGPFLDAMKKVLSALFPDAVFMPVLATGFTDSRYFRKYGTQAFGLIPPLYTREQIESIHGIDERISEKQLEEGIKIITALVVELTSR